MAMRRWAAAIGHDHIDQAIPSGSLLAGNEDTVCVAHDSDMAHPGTVRVRDRQLAIGVVGRVAELGCNGALAVSVILISPQGERMAQ